MRIGHVNEYPTMHYFGIPRHTPSMIAYKSLTEYSGKSSETLHCGNVVNMPYLGKFPNNSEHFDACMYMYIAAHDNVGP